ncbi:MAG: XdhC family protein, partial [Zoogloea sp.]|nr:XdhC family protein [Zoogloea sp.]
MHELEAIARAARRAVDASETPVLATVLEVTGSSYRQPGAHMLVTGDGWQAGSISGGCLEGDIVRRGAWLTRAGQVTLAYDTSDDEAAYGLGCGGSIRVLLERLGGGRTDLLGFLEACLARRQPGVVATVIASPGNEPRPGERLLFAAGRVLQHDFHDADTPAVL